MLFLLLGMQMLIVHMKGTWLLATLAVIPIVLLARAVSVASLISLLNPISPQPRGAIPVLAWGSLRGGISVALALSLPADNTRDLLLTLTYGVVIFSILVQGLTIGWVVRRTSDCEPHAASVA